MQIKREAARSPRETQRWQPPNLR